MIRMPLHLSAHVCAEVYVRGVPNKEDTTWANKVACGDSRQLELGNAGPSSVESVANKTALVDLALPGLSLGVHDSPLHVEPIDPGRHARNPPPPTQFAAEHDGAGIHPELTGMMSRIHDAIYQFLI